MSNGTLMTRVSSSLKLPLRETFRHDADTNFGRVICLYWSEDALVRPHWIDFEIFEAVGRESPGALISTRPNQDGAPLYYTTEKREITDGVTSNLERAIWMARGFVKSDGCTQIYFPKGPVHYDDLIGPRGLFGAICRVQERCYEIMDDGADDGVVAQ